MEEDAGVKVTRLRRRLSVEKTEDVSSPSTPTKKRGGRLAAKPQLDLIDENAQISSPRKGRRKSLVKDLADAEEKPVTPSRRSTRIKSNTSIVSETMSQVTDSPRARRAHRRNSHAGSDTEGPATPARQTRKTRKDSASSVENQEPAVSRPLQVVEMVIAEEPETDIHKQANELKSTPKIVAEELSPSSPRKSKRLLEKKNRRSGSYKSDHDLSLGSVENKSLNISSKDEIPGPKTEVKSRDQLNKSGESNEVSEKLSESNMNLLKSLNTDPKVNTSNHNKSVSSLDIKKKKRNRTESWPMVLASPAKDYIVFSDNEQSKKNKKKSANDYSWINNSKLGVNNTSVEGDSNKTVHNDTDDLHRLVESPSKRKKRKSDTSFANDMEILSEPVQLNKDITLNKASSTFTENTNVKPENEHVKDGSNNTENTAIKPENNDVPIEMAKFFEKATNVQAIVYFEDSDSNSVNIETTTKTQQLDNEDQCVPVVKHDNKFQEKMSPVATNLSNEQQIIFQSQPITIETESCSNLVPANAVDNSCEPMDIDETVHEEILQNSLSQGSFITEESNNSERKSSISNADTPKSEIKSTLILSQIKNVSTTSDKIHKSPKPREEILQKSLNSLQPSIVDPKSLSQNNSITEKPKRKSSISATDTSKSENKSTLILSQIKDVSTTADNVLKSPKPQSSEALSESMNDPKGTPLKQINVQKLTMQTSTPIAAQQINESVNNKERKTSPKKNNSNLTKSINDSRSSEEDSDEISGHKSNLMDDEAEEASEDYESGDSRDEEEREYEDEHEIIERGETLGSEEDITNDSDYEKDSFVVGSDAEDEDLLSGSGDDLSMSDKELSMSKKSKNKYNERKLKEQKNASREMFESRHKLKTAEKKSPASKPKNNRMRIDSSLLESDEEILVKAKKNNRLRLDSTLDTSDKQEDANDTLNKSIKKNNKSMQKSICNQSAINEKEMTICNESVIDVIDPLQVHFKKEPKSPQINANISVVEFTSRADIENVDVDEGKSMLNQTESDPLQDTMVCEDSSDSSENEEIMQNYDSVLNELNKSKKGKPVGNNLSLNMDKKGKRNRSEPILDQLNLTHPKTPKKNNKTQSQDVVDSKMSELTRETQDSEHSSSSIDLKLLFSEDNSESGDENIKKKREESNEGEKEIVPLRKSTGKTIVRESVGNLFFIDTTGVQDNEKLKLSPLMLKQLPFIVEDNDSPVEAPLEVFVSKKKKKNKLDASQNNVDTNGEDTIITEENPQSNSKKRKRKSSDTGKAHDSVVEGVPEVVDPGVHNESLSGGGLKKKRKTSHQDGVIEQHDIEAENEANDEKQPKKKKKKSRDGSFQSTGPEKDDNEADNEKQAKKNKKKSREANLLNTAPETETSQAQIKKNKKRKGSISNDLQLSFSEDNCESGDKNINKRKAERDAEEKEIVVPLGKSTGKANIQESVGEDIITTEEGSLLNSKKRKRKSSDTGKAHDSVVEETIQPQIKKNKKRKERDEDNDRKSTKVSKDNSFHEVHMAPLPASILSQLDDKPRTIPEKPNVISTSKFVVENARQKRAKPSKFLEESIYLDASSPLAKKDKSRMKKPKVLPFIPTASISESGFTTKFKIKKVSENVQFIAEPAGIAFSKEKYLQKKEIKRLGTYDLYKKQIKRKLSKF